MRASPGGSSGPAGIRPVAATPGLPSLGVSGNSGHVRSTPFAHVACYQPPASHPASAWPDVRWLPQLSTQGYEGLSCAYTVDCPPQAASNAPPSETTGLVRRAASSSPPRAPPRAQAEPIGGTHSRRAKTPSHRRIAPATQTESTGPHARRVKAASAAVRTIAGVEGRGITGSTEGGKQPPLSLGCTDTPEALNFPHLRQHSTWRLLRRLVDELEDAQRNGANPLHSRDSFLQKPEALQQLLQPFMRLLPLREMLHQLLERAESSTHVDRTSLGQGGAAGPPPLSKLRRTRYSSPQLTPQRSAAFRFKSTRGPASSAASAWLEGGGGPHSSNSSFARASPSRVRRPLAASLSRGRGGTGRAGEPSVEAQLIGLITGSKKASAAPREPTPGHRQGAARSASVEGLEGAAPTARERVVPVSRLADVGKPVKGGGLAAHAQRSPERPWPGRSVSTARHGYPQPKLQVASRLPPGALQHRRSPKTRLVPSTAADKRQQQQQQQQQVRFSEAWEKLMRCAPVTPDPPDSSRSADEEDTLRSAYLTEKGGPPACRGDPPPSRAAAEGWGPPSPWTRDLGFTSVRVLGALPPSPPSAPSIEAASGQEEDPFQEAGLQRRGSSAIVRQGENGGVESNEPSAVHTGRPRHPLRIAAPRVSPLRRHAAAAAPLSASGSIEGERQLGRSGRNEPVGISRRDKRLTLAEAMKRRGEALAGKAGRLTPRDADVEDEAQQQAGAGNLGVSSVRETARPREGRRAATQSAALSSPKNGASVSPRRSLFTPKTKAEKTQQASHSKAVMRKDSAASLLKSSSSRGLAPPLAAGGGRVSAPPAPRKPSAQPKPPPSPPPRARHSAAPAAAEAKVGALPLKNSSSRKRGGKGAAGGKVLKGKGSAESKAELALSETSNAPEEEEEELHVVEEAGSIAEPPQTPPEPPYPFLRLTELPLLDAPLRPLPSLTGILPLRADNQTPPKVDDNVTFMHVLDRSEHLTETARNQATRHAVANLSSDAPGTMLLIARWMDTTVEAVEADTAAAKERLPWREVIPPLFVGLETHRELLSPRHPRNPRVLEELKAFLEAEGFVETQEQKLRQLLASKSDSLKPANDNPEKPKAPTMLDIYLDYVLAVALAYLRLRQQPVVLRKPSRYVIGGRRNESGGSTCCQSDDACCSRDSSLASSDAGACRRDGFGGTDTREEPLSTAAGSSLAKDDLLTPRAQRRCWSCLPVRGSKKSCLLPSGSSSCSTSSLITRCLSPAARGPPELDLFESTAAQQVRRLVDQTPLLPSEKYLRYLRIAGKKKELETLAKWLAGRPDVLPGYDAFAKLLQKQDEAAPLLKINGAEKAGGSLANAPVSIEQEASRVTSGLSQGGCTNINNLVTHNTPQQVPAPGQDTARLSSAGEKEDSLEPSGSISLPPNPRSPRFSPALPLSFSGGVAVIDQQVIEGSRTTANHLLAPPSAAISGDSQQCIRGALKESTWGPPAGAQAASDEAPTSSMQPPSWGRPAEPLPHKQTPNGAKSTIPASHPRASSTVASVAKMKGGKKAPPAKSMALRVMQSFDKGGAALKPASSHGAGQKFSPKLRLRQGSVRNLQGASSGLQSASPPFPSSAQDLEESEEFEATRFPVVSQAKLAALASVGSDLRATYRPGTHKLGSTSIEEAFIAPPQRKAASTSRQPRLLSPQSSSGRLSASLYGALHHMGPTPSRKGPYVPTPFPRRALATATPKRAGGGGHPPGSRSLSRPQRARQKDQWTGRAAKLLSEPQMLAEVASLCSRLSALTCCVQPGENGMPHEKPPDESEPLEFIEVAS